MKPYRQLRNSILPVKSSGIDAELYFTFELYRKENGTGKLPPIEDKVKHYSPIYCRNSLALIDSYAQPRFYPTEDYENQLISIDGKRKSTHTLALSEAYISVGYTDEEISVSDIKAKNVKAITKAYLLRSSYPEHYLRSYGNVSDPFSPDLGKINEIALYVDIFDNGNTGSVSRYLYMHFKTEPFEFTSKKGTIDMGFLRILKM